MRPRRLPTSCARSCRLRRSRRTWLRSCCSVPRTRPSRAGWAVGVAELRRRASAPALPLTPHSDSDDAVRPLRLALAGGGTGGHVLPGRHLVEHGRARGELADLVWFQTGRTVEDSAMAGFE